MIVNLVADQLSSTMEVSCAILLSLCILAIIFYYLTRPFTYWKNQGILKAPNINRLFGHVKSVLFLQESLSKVCNRAHQDSPEDSSMTCLYFLHTPMLVVREPELAKRILVKEFQSFRNNLMVLNDERDSFMSKNYPFFAADDVWKQQRIQLVGNMSQKKLRVLYRILNGVSTRFVNYVDLIMKQRGSMEFELKELFSRFTSELVANTAFGVEAHSFSVDPHPRSFVSMMNKFFEPTLLNGFRVTVNCYLPNLASLLGVGFISREVNQFLKNSVGDVMSHRRENNIVVEDFLQMAMDALGKSAGEDVIAGHMSSFFFDAHDSNATVAACAICEPAYHPNVQRRAREQIRNTLEKYAGALDYEAFKDLTYLDQIIYETVRLHPIVGINVKSCTQKITLEGTDGQTCDLKPGHIVIVPVQSFHTDKKYWNDPSTFDPDRFSEERKHEVNKYAFLPFGDEPRMCAGMKYGMTVKTMLVAILRDYKIDSSPRMQYPLKLDQNSNLTFAKGGLWARLRRI